MTDSILLFHGDAGHLRILGQHFERLGYEVARELDAASGLAMYDRIRPDVVVVDQLLPDADEALRHLLERRAAIILLADDAANASGTSWLAAGCDYVLPRDVDLDRLSASAARAAGRTRSRRIQAVLLGPAGRGRLESMGTASPMRELAAQAAALAHSDRAMVLLTGPRGSGKGWVARLIHDLGPRAQEPFLEAHCAAADAPALDSLLFGHEKGALPDAADRRRGLFEIASSGTLVLRGVAALPLELQPKLLRALETRTFRRVGGTRDISSDVRVIACTAADLGTEVEAERFRGDLYYRLSVVTLAVPAVSERSEQDRLALITSVYAGIQRTLPGSPPAIAVETLERMLGYPWPGNVREIRSVLERSAILAHGQPTIGIECLPGEFRARPGLGDRRHTPMSLDDLERGHIERTLRFHGGNRTRAARELGISRATLINKIKRYQLTD